MPGDFREFFDPRKLDDQTRGSIEFVLNSLAYQDYFKPYMEGVLRQLEALWKDRRQSRKDEYPDDFLAGGAAFGEGLLKFTEILIQETNMDRVHNAMENMTSDMLYEAKRQRGKVLPVVGINQPASPADYTSDENF